MATWIKAEHESIHVLQLLLVMQKCASFCQKWADKPSYTTSFTSDQNRQLSPFNLDLAGWAKLPSWPFLWPSNKDFKQMYSEPLKHALSPCERPVESFSDFI